MWDMLSAATGAKRGESVEEERERS